MTKPLIDQEPNAVETDQRQALLAELALLRLDEATLTAILFGEDTAGKTFKDISARVRDLLEVAHLASIACGPFAMIDRHGYELVQPSDMDRLRQALERVSLPRTNGLKP